MDVSTKVTSDPGLAHEALEDGTAAAAAVAAGEKKEVALLPATKEQLSTRKEEVGLNLSQIKEAVSITSKLSSTFSINDAKFCIS